MKGFVGTVISGAIGLAALYVVGKVAFQAGYDIAEAECRYEQLQRGIKAKESKTEEDVIETDESEPETTAVAEYVPEKKQSKLGMLFGLRKALGKKGTSVVSDLIQNPDGHIFEACVKGREIHVNVKPKTTNVGG